MRATQVRLHFFIQLIFVIARFMRATYFPFLEKEDGSPGQAGR
jgi:hypothetical protein